MDTRTIQIQELTATLDRVRSERDTLAIWRLASMQPRQFSAPQLASVEAQSLEIARSVTGCRVSVGRSRQLRLALKRAS